MLSDSKAVTSPLQQLFTIRYTTLFQSIPKKQFYNTIFNNLFNSFINTQLTSAQIQLGIALSLLTIFIAIIIPLSLSLLNIIDQTILLFGFMSRNEVEKQIQNCNSFLQIFYQDSYLVWLKKKQKLKEILPVNNLVSDDDASMKLNVRKDETSKFLQSFASNNASQAELAYPSSQNIIKNSMNRIEFLQKQLHLRTEAEIMVSQTQQQNENQLLKGQIDSSQEDAIYDHLSQDKNNNKIKQITIYIILVLTLSCYFILEYFMYKDYQMSIKHEISNIHLAYENINALKKVRLYSLQSLIDNSPFQNYSSLRQTSANQYSNLYYVQRKFDSVAMMDIQQFNLYYRNICDIGNINLMKNVAKLFPSSAFSQKECVNVLHQVLVEGLRLGIVGYTQTFFNFTKMMNFSLIVNDSSFLQARQIQKYIEAPLRIFQSTHSALIPSILNNQIQSLIILLLGFYIILTILWIAVWRYNLNGLHDKLRSTREILGFIPVRVFIKNTKLTKEYEKYIGELME